MAAPCVYMCMEFRTQSTNVPQKIELNCTEFRLFKKKKKKKVCIEFSGIRIYTVV
ncbi:hypothetical protein PGB90_010249 [Kerria lacca]